MPEFGQWKYRVDHEATRAAYAEVESGGVDTCDCRGCRNFRLARALVFPVEFLALLDQLGIDPTKDGEIFHSGPLAPGCHVYGGWYHFIGVLDETGDFPVVDFGDDFRIWMCRADAPRLSSLKDKPAVQLEFRTDSVPWLLDEPESS